MYTPPLVNPKPMPTLAFTHLLTHRGCVYQCAGAGRACQRRVGDCSSRSADCTVHCMERITGTGALAYGTLFRGRGDQISDGKDQGAPRVNQISSHEFVIQEFGGEQRSPVVEARDAQALAAVRGAGEPLRLGMSQRNGPRPAAATGCGRTARARVWRIASGHSGGSSRHR